VNKLQKKRLAIWVVIIAGLMGFIIVTSVQANRYDAYFSTEIESDKWQPLLETIYLIKNQYYSEQEIDENDLMEEAIRGVLKATGDPYARYLNEEDLKIETSDRIEGEFSGLGIVIAIKDDKLTVITPYQGSPASQAGVKAGDVISQIDGESTTGMPLDEAVRRLRGDRGTKVVIQLQREGIEEPITVTVVRDIIKIKSVEFELLEEGIGLIRIIEYHGRTNLEVEDAIKQLKLLEVKGLVIDLRNNPGGLLSSAIICSGLFVPRDTNILFIEDRNGNRETLENPVDKIVDLPMVALINKGTASGAEIMAGIFQVILKTPLIGETTFGKGVVQQIFPLSHQGGVIFTISKYYLPDGTDINGEGIQPNVVVENEEEQVDIAIQELKRIINEKEENVSE
jgi:carboxyl-terminal processing protease